MIRVNDTGNEATPISKIITILDLKLPGVIPSTLTNKDLVPLDKRKFDQRRKHFCTEIGQTLAGLRDN